MNPIAPKEADLAASNTALLPPESAALLAQKSIMQNHRRPPMTLPEAALGGAIGLIEEGDDIHISIADRRLHLDVEPGVLAARRAAMEAKGQAAWAPTEVRERRVTPALKVFAAFATSASEGAARDVDGATQKMRQAAE